MLVIFLALIIGPIVAGKYLGSVAKSIPLELVQPTGQNNNDTLGTLRTGSALIGVPATAGVAGPTQAATSAAGNNNPTTTQNTDNPFSFITGRALATAMAMVV